MHHILCESPFISRDIYAIRPLILWHILGAYFLQIWGVGGGQNYFHLRVRCLGATGTDGPNRAVKGPLQVVGLFMVFAALFYKSLQGLMQAEGADKKKSEQERWDEGRAKLGERFRKARNQDRYRPKGVFGKGVGNSKNAPEMRQKCVKNASKMLVG